MRFNEKELAYWASSFVPDREGMMDKKGANKGQGYKQRWFRLKGNLLFYYKLDEFGGWQAAEPLGVIVLERCHPDRMQHDSRPYSFMLSFEGDDTRTYFLSAYSQDDLKGWMKAIKMASYEGLRATLYQLQSKLLAMTGEDPLKDKGVSIIAPQFSPHKEITRSSDVRRTILPRGSYKFTGKKKLSTQLTVPDSLPQFELSLSCSNLPLCEGGKPPTTQVRVRSYAKPSDRQPLATLFKSEVIESSTSPSYSHLLLLELGIQCSPSAMLEFGVFSVNYNQSEDKDSCHLVGATQKIGDPGQLIGSAECLVSAVTASSADGKQLKLPLVDQARHSLVCGFLFISVTKVDELQTGSPMMPRRNAISPPDSKSPIGLLPTIMFHPIRCHFSFPATVQDNKVKLKVFEEMTECVFNIQVPIELLKCYIKEDSVLLEELRTIGALDDTWGDLLQQYQMMLFESIGYYGNAIKEMEDLGDTCGFKSSVQKRDRELEFVPTNLHIQRMRVQTEGKAGETSYSFVTCGCHADHVEGFKSGGLKKILSGCRSCPSFISKFTEGRASAMKNYIARLRSIQETIQSCTNTLYRACANASPQDMNDAMIGVSKQIQQLFSLMESKTVKDAIDALIQARPGSSSPSSLASNGGGVSKDSSAVKRSTLKRRSQIPSGWKCNCGKCSKCLPSPSDWVWNGKSFIQVSKEWKMHDSADSIQEVLVTLINNVETATRKVVDQRHEAVASEVSLGISTFKPTYVWSLDLIPLFAKLNQSLDGLFRITSSALSFAIVQMDSHVSGLKALKRRRDVVFSQALTTLATAFYMMLSKHFENAEFLRQIRMIGFLAQFESLLSSVGDESGMLEDMHVVVSELASVSFQMAELRRDMEEEDVMFDFHIFGTRDSLTIQLLIPRELLAQLPDEGIRQGERIRVVPVLFTQGVNEKQTFANIRNDLPLLASSVQLQEEVNSQSIEVLSNYVEEFQKCMHTGGSNSRLRAVRTKDLLNLLKQSYSSHKSKNVEFLITVEQLVHWLKGGRLTSCKSGKDRTSMSVTLEECSLLRTMHHLDNSAFNTTLSTLRSHGTRLENCHKNTGHRCYHFNQIQLMLLPKLLTPPPFTCRDPE